MPQEDKLRAALIAGGIQTELAVRDKGLGMGAAALKAHGLEQKVEAVTLTCEREFFESDPPVADFLMTSAEEGSAWTLKYPQYSVVRPKGWDARTPLHYFVAEECRFEEFMNSWLQLKRLNGIIDQLYDYWILGIDTQAGAARWSIIRNVLHWVE